MESYNTKYGVLQHIGEYSLYLDGAMKECMLLGEVEINTEYGVLIPQFEFEEHRRKYIYSLSFYEDGSIRRIALNNKTAISTPVGIMEAELITFYRSGKIKRLFPLNGRMSAYWDENDEYKLAAEDTIDLPGNAIRTKVIAYSFYENGAIKDLTFWPKEVVILHTPVGEVRVRIGVSFYQSGKVKSFEPSFPVLVQTPIGKVKAFDSNANGISGDKNSLVYSEDGILKELVTSGMKVTVQDKEGTSAAAYSPEQDWDEDGLEISFTALKLTFEDNTVCFNEMAEYDISQNTFIIEPYYKTAPSMCSDCESCGLCSQ